MDGNPHVAYSFIALFIALNIVRALSIIALLLVFSSSIVVLVDDIEAVNHFVNGATNTTAFDSGNSNYVPCVSIFSCRESQLPD